VHAQVGYLDQRDYLPARLGIVFAMPSTLESEKPFCSLYDYISSRGFKAFQPDLGARFELACQLVRGFLQFHQLGWLHKNLTLYSSHATDLRQSSLHISLGLPTLGQLRPKFLTILLLTRDLIYTAIPIIKHSRRKVSSYGMISLASASYYLKSQSGGHLKITTTI
jgi:hypothetical protein